MNFNLVELQNHLNELKNLENTSYYEFLKVPSMSVGLYKLSKGEKDNQKPHTEDEIYVIIEGKASFQNRDTFTEISKGDILFVEANKEHRFYDITEDLTTLVFFSPAEYSNK
ncbi:cupin domain-containing protein [Paenibacillus planticolens]|uniref:Cupin domain-containing protein n=1 Tax=Paenibacillus planticolens TaxID=2654976 RepID=A0ABX1ZEU1_9BACL|nr:cupin domain-containing protein [Paenibacillus planticolens]NOU98614.1 cupin domain-containing protein [Paenibacillus planticolens]